MPGHNLPIAIESSQDAVPTALTTTPEPPAPLIPRRKRWTRDECALLESSGIWERERLELIDGELISKLG